VWNTDSGGNYLSNLVGVVSGSSSVLESLESSFHQDLNGDGTVGLTSRLIENAGSTVLYQVADGYSLGSPSGPSVKYAGTPYVAGQSWRPIGAEKTAGGYEVAWKAGDADQYAVWNTDSGGNYLSNLVGVVSGSNSVLERQESSFHQDLNGDGTVGVPVVSTGSSAGVTMLTIYAATMVGNAGVDGTTGIVHVQNHDHIDLTKPQA
jgi:serralysin